MNNTDYLYTMKENVFMWKEMFEKAKAVQNPRTVSPFLTLAVFLLLY
jgi:hypothetical protein